MSNFNAKQLQTHIPATISLGDYSPAPITNSFAGMKSAQHKLANAIALFRDTGRADERIRQRTASICREHLS